MTGKTYPELTPATDAEDADLLATYRSPGPVKKLTASAFANYVVRTALTFIQSAIGAVYRTVTDKLRERVSIKDFGGVGDGVTDDTAAFVLALAHSTLTGTAIVCPLGAWRHGPLIMLDNAALFYEPGATVVPILTGGTERLYRVTGDNCTIRGLTISNVSGTITGNKYLCYVTGENFYGTGFRFANITASDGNLGLTNLLTTIGVYLDSAANYAVVRDYQADVISGPAFFAKQSSGWVLEHFRFNNTGWYSVSADHSCFDCHIRYGEITGDDTNARFWGGSLNFMSNTVGLPNARFFVSFIRISGAHSYGTVVRVLSCANFTFDNITLDRCYGGALTPDPQLQYITIDRRGTAVGAAENGPVTDLIMNNVQMVASGECIAVYIKNQYIGTRDPHKNIVLDNFVLTSPSTSDYFMNGLAVHGFQGGIDGLTVTNFVGTAKTIATSPVNGAASVLSTDLAGQVKNARISVNLTDITTDVPNQSFQTGLRVAEYCDQVDVTGSRFENFRYGVRTDAANITNLRGIYATSTPRCLTPYLLSTEPTAGPVSNSIGTALPTSGVFLAGHRVEIPVVAAGGFTKWVCVTEGAATSATWSATTYAAGVWIANSSNRGYELLTAGGGAASVEPTGTTVGGTETGADGYAWLCRATTKAIFVPETRLPRTNAAAYDPPNLAAGAGVTTTIAVTGAAVGDMVQVSFGADLQGITLTGYVSAAGVVSCRFQNGTSGAIDLASASLSVSTRASP